MAKTVEKVLSANEKLDIAVGLLDKQGLDEYVEECNRRETAKPTVERKTFSEQVEVLKALHKKSEIKEQRELEITVFKIICPVCNTELEIEDGTDIECCNCNTLLNDKGIPV